MAENKHIAFCGLDCMKCGAYIAKRENNDALRRETAEKWNKELNLNLKPEDMNCDGCLTEIVGNMLCPIRVCAKGKGVLNCAYCKDYACDKLDKNFQTAPGCKETLDSIKKSRK
jgi:hypothetical protein